MMRSMTGFASASAERPPFVVSATVRAVNHRFLDLQLRLPSGVAALEPGLRALVPRRLSRGRVEISVNVQSTAPPSVTVTLNTGLARELHLVLEGARREGLVEGALSVSDLLRLPQALVIREHAAAADLVEPGLARAVEEVVDEALQALDGMRAREGELLGADLDRRRAGLAEAIDAIETAALEAQGQLRGRLATRVAELAGGGADGAALAQEIVRFVARSDIHEEVVRFRAHLTHWTSLVAGDEPSGRKLDFLLQEMNREINTIGSKAEGSRVPALVVDAKAELERMREQVQNVE
jgi:uncharacterized protein (TIGR00255 family)